MAMGGGVRVGVGGEGGVKGLPDDNFEPQAKKNKLSVAANLI